jgi:hypothetical protein
MVAWEIQIMEFSNGFLAIYFLSWIFEISMENSNNKSLFEMSMI